MTPKGLSTSPFNKGVAVPGDHRAPGSQRFAGLTGDVPVLSVPLRRAGQNATLPTRKANECVWETLGSGSHEEMGKAAGQLFSEDMGSILRAIESGDETSWIGIGRQRRQAGLNMALFPRTAEVWGGVGCGGRAALEGRGSLEPPLRICAAWSTGKSQGAEPPLVRTRKVCR